VVDLAGIDQVLALLSPEIDAVELLAVECTLFDKRFSSRKAQIDAEREAAIARLEKLDPDLAAKVKKRRQDLKMSQRTAPAGGGLGRWGMRVPSGTRNENPTLPRFRKGGLRRPHH
jgi:hypothetical protein